MSDTQHRVKCYEAIHAFSRWRERKADRVALDLTQNPDGFIRAMCKLAHLATAAGFVGRTSPPGAPKCSDEGGSFGVCAVTERALDIRGRQPTRQACPPYNSLMAAVSRCALRKLADQNLADLSPHPVIEFLLHDHPSLESRSALAQEWQQN